MCLCPILKFLFLFILAFTISESSFTSLGPVNHVWNTSKEELNKGIANIV